MKWAGFRKGRGIRDQIANIRWVTEKAREFQKKKSTSASLTTLKLLAMWITTNQQTHKEMGILDHLSCLLWNLYAGQEATFRTEHGTTDWYKTGKGVHQGCILSPCLFNSYAEHTMQNARLDEAQAGIRIPGRNINNLRYAEDTIPYGRKRRRAKEPPDEGERGQWKSWLKTQLSKS